MRVWRGTLNHASVKSVVSFHAMTGHSMVQLPITVEAQALRVIVRKRRVATHKRLPVVSEDNLKHM